MNEFNNWVIEQFRANGGRVDGPFEGARLLLLTTTGARSGRRHTTPLGYLPDGERVLVIGSAGGADFHPAWFHNVRADPRVTVEDGAFTYEADAVVLDRAERDAVFARAVAAEPGWDEYQRATSRILPVVALVPAGPPGADSAPGSVADMLVRVHAAFRTELRRLRSELSGSGTTLGAQLRINCLTLCQGLHNHHVGEDAGLFAAIIDRHPEASDVVARLTAEHERIAETVEQLRLAARAESRDLARAEIDRLTAELEQHLDDEEEWLLPLLRTW
ncbi:cation-binding protein [Saccharomonospora sp. CUA-673]|uniref:nitroreductase/quinone reductase family protein n=1 Tax=Saccharomonospora sp. CUA-673 TaxID=1904969 RepID=UPI0009624AB6|nr:nitroreductase/quinone reductase family protein [Saccharomonospora sp. CUA-673]OLT45365.1 cation-binding protein [Saccharomonospora sp. CUA-673]